MLRKISLIVLIFASELKAAEWGSWSECDRQGYQRREQICRFRKCSGVSEHKRRCADSPILNVLRKFLARMDVQDAKIKNLDTKYQRLTANVTSNTENQELFKAITVDSYGRLNQTNKNLTLELSLAHEKIKNFEEKISDMEQQLIDLTAKINESEINENSKENIEKPDLQLPYTCSGKEETETIYPWKDNGDLQSVDVNCNLYSVDKDGWITIQKRFNGSVRFYDRNWENYARGFGNKDGEFWLGLRTINQLTTAKNYKLRIDMGFKDGSQRYAEYSTFKVGSEEDKFQLTLSGNSDDAYENMVFHNGQYFSTVDVDNDPLDDESCALLYHGAWWYNTCHMFHLNGKYDSDFSWSNILLKFSEMKIHLA